MPEWVKILQAAQIGMGWTDEKLAERSATPLPRLQELKAGLLDPPTLRNVARALHLGGDALLALAREDSRSSSTPTPRTVRGIELASGRGYLVWDSPSRLASLIDIGEACPAVARLLESEFLVPRYLFFTEPSRTAEASWVRFLESRGALPFSGQRGDAEETFPLGTLQIDRRRIAAQSGREEFLFLIRGMEVPVAFVGRSLQPPSAEALDKEGSLYRGWLDAVRSHIFTLSDETLLCPSAGPITSVGFEKAHNPFFPEFEHFSSFARLTEESDNL